MLSELFYETVQTTRAEKCNIHVCTLSDYLPQK